MSANHGAVTKLGEGVDPKQVSRQDWQKVLTPEQFEVTRERGTEKAFSGQYVKFTKDGTYTCLCCGAVLFESDCKFYSHCGWPSFFAAAGEKTPDCNVERRVDTSYGMERIEVVCKKCNAHLGHVFEDGPQPTGERYCINSVAINFLPKNQ